MKRGYLVHAFVLAAAGYLVFGCGGGGGGTSGGGSNKAAYVAFGFNDLGMHCMGQTFDELCILPPANTLRTQVIRRGDDPHIVTSGVTVLYSIPGNTNSVTKTNFWDYSLPLFGVALSPNMGLFGKGLSGTMDAKTGYFEAAGIPLTPITDARALNAYQLSKIRVMAGGTEVASTQAVVPVSWEMSCNLCHSPGDPSQTNATILADHDRLHGTRLQEHKPVLCASCHADPALGQTGNPALPNLSRAMHGAHASRMSTISLQNACYACHPGVTTQCQRDIHSTKGITCTTCHGDMDAISSPARTPWSSLPKCGSCHRESGHQYEQSGKLFKESLGHHGVMCASCHGSPHAITPSTQPNDNVQSIALQGEAGPIKACTVCHTKQPDDSFEHRYSN